MARAALGTTRARASSKNGWMARWKPIWDTARRLFTLICVLQMRG